MITGEQKKEYVVEKYTQIAKQSKQRNDSSCCGSGCCSTIDEAIFSEDYSKVAGYTPEADLGLGCGIPTQFAKIKEGDIVVDLGSGAGNDCFVAREQTGPHGFVVGIDMTQEMVEKALENTKARGYDNVDFKQGEIEQLPIKNSVVDVVISNCVFNLVPNKDRAFAETYRILKPGGHFCISDVVLTGELPQKLATAAEMYAGCVSGAINKHEYIFTIASAGFINIEIQKEKQIVLPDDILSQYLTPEEITDYKNAGSTIQSITVYAEKSEDAEDDMSGGGCCGSGGNHGCGCH